MRNRKIQDASTLTQGLTPLLGWGELRLGKKSKNSPIVSLNFYTQATPKEGLKE